jgi:hypothetical protein
MSGLFAALTVPFVYLIAAEGREERDAVPIIAVGALVVNSQFNIWNASGLENSLFNLLLAAAMWRTLRDPIHARWPISAVLFFALAITRPEAIIYAAFGGGVFLALSLFNRRGLAPTGRWLLLFFAPFTLYHVVRYNYFGWLLPNTYYAKLGDDTPKPLGYNFRGWKYLRRYASYNGKDNEPGLAIGYLLPIFGAAVSGGRGLRALLAVSATVILAALFFFPVSSDLGGIISGLATDFTFSTPNPGVWLEEVGVLNESASWTKARAGILWVGAILFLGLGIGRSHGAAAFLSFGMALISLFFAVWANGDWMKGYRWLSLCSVPMSVLFALGLGVVGDALGRISTPRLFIRWGVTGWATVLTVAILFSTVQIRHADWFHSRRETGPQAVKKRVNYMNSVRERMHLEQATGMDVDMGAHMWWSGWDLIDMAGLVDVPIAHHNYEKPFMREYIFQERRPELPHVHGAWAKQTKIPQHSEWKQDFIEIPGFPAGPKALHIGNHVRRDLLMVRDLPAWAEDPSTFGPVTLYGPHIPFTTTAPGNPLYVELAIKTSDLRKSPGIMIVGFLAQDGQVKMTWDIAPGYDWLAPKQWKKDEFFVGKYALPIATLSVSEYEFGIAMFDREGNIISADVPQTTPYYASGEMRFNTPISITSGKAIKAQANVLVNLSEDQANALNCDEAESTWQLVRQRMPSDEGWQSTVRPRVARAISNCLSVEAHAQPERQQKITLLARAKIWDHHAPIFLQTRTPLVSALTKEAISATENADWELAYRLNSEILSLDPQQSFARKRAEEARDYRLEIDPTSVARKQREREERRATAQEKQRERNRKKREEGLERKKEGKALPPGATQKTPRTE